MVQVRNFKAAKTVTDEIKDLTHQIEILEGEIEALKRKQNNIQEKLSEIEERKSKSNQMSKQLKERTDVARYFMLVHKEKDLNDLHEFSLKNKRYQDCDVLKNEVGGRFRIIFNLLYLTFIIKIFLLERVSE